MDGVGRFHIAIYITPKKQKIIRNQFSHLFCSSVMTYLDRWWWWWCHSRRRRRVDIARVDNWNKNEKYPNPFVVIQLQWVVSMVLFRTGWVLVEITVARYRTIPILRVVCGMPSYRIAGRNAVLLLLMVVVVVPVGSEWFEHVDRLAIHHSMSRQPIM